MVSGDFHCSKFKLTDPGYDKVGKIGSDGKPLVCVCLHVFVDYYLASNLQH